MPFIHPAIFWTGLAAAGVPILIHLLNRRRFRVRDWAAMEFVRQALRRHRRRLQIEQLILLALRCLIIALVAGALARFTGCGSLTLLPSADVGRTTIFVLDDSVSMGQKLGPTTAFDLATADLGEQLEQFPDGETVAIRRTGDPDDSPLFAMNFVTDRTSLVTKLRTLQPSDGRADLAAALGWARQLLSNQPGAKRLVLLGDFRRVDLQSDRVGAVRQAVAALTDADVDVIVMDYGRAAQTNLTITSLKLVDRFVIAGSEARVAVTVRNNGAETARDAPVRIALRLPADGDEQATIDLQLPVQTIASIEPGGSRRVEFDVTFARAGSAALIASLSADELPGDNTAYLDIQVREAIRVLLVDGRPNPTAPTDSESFTFAAAVDPSGVARSGARVDVIAVDDVSATVFEDYDVVALLDVAELPARSDAEGTTGYPQLDALEQYVRTGGGLVITTGQRVNLSFYNGPMFAGGNGLSPYRIGPPKGDPVARQSFVRLDPKRIDPVHPFLRFFQGERQVLTGFIRFFAFTPAEEIALSSDPPDEAAAADTAGVSPPRVLAHFTDEDASPAIAARSFGRGQIVMIYSTTSPRWNDWADDQPNGIYVTPIQDLIRALARGQGRQTSPAIAAPMTYAPPKAFADAPAVLKLPSFPASDLVMLGSADGDGGDAARLSYAGTHEAGIYILTLDLPDGRRHAALLARNIDPAEGELAPAGRDGLTVALDSNAFQYIQRTAGTSVGVVQTSKREEHWLWLMAALAILVVAETLLAQRFGHHSAAESTDQDQGTHPQ